MNDSLRSNDWQDLGPVSNFKNSVTQIEAGGQKVAIISKHGEFGAISGTCNHAGGPLGKGKLDGDFVICPWHHWKYHWKTGRGEPGYEDEAVPSYEVRVENGHLFLRAQPVTQRSKLPHPAHPLSRPVKREEGPIRVAGISTTAMDRNYPRYSTSEALLQISLEHAASELQCETRLIKLNDLQFRNCEGYYSKSEQACTWPCSITQMDKKDELTQVYEALVHWADVILVATPIRWGAASSLYFKMVERLNCVQNQITVNNRVLIQNKVASFIITGGQDNIQAVAGQMLNFFSELGFYFPQFPFIAHSLGWSAEDMEHNVDYVMKSEDLKKGAKELISRSVKMAGDLLKSISAPERIARGGRKAHRLDVQS